MLFWLNFLFNICALTFNVSLLACVHDAALIGNVVLGRVGGEDIDHVGGLGLLADHLDEGLLDFYMRR